MSKNLFALTAIIFFVTLVCGCSSSAETGKNISAQENEVDLVEEKLKTLSLEEKIGQMMLVGVNGKSFDENMNFLVSQYHVGGIIFFDRNMENKAQVKKFTEDLQAAAKIPLFIALDEEGGMVARMKHDLTPPPSQESIGLSGDFNLAKIHAEETARKLREIGVNINFAPVADVGSRDTRSFSTDANIVAEFVSSAASGYDAENFFYCLKHFPGIGLSKIDPHKDISSIDLSKDALMAQDVLPFKKVIDEHDNSKFMVMVGHLKYPALDPQNTASLSPAIVTNLLRGELNFTGVIITDDLEMGATANYNSFDGAGVQAVKAGADIILVCHEYEHEKTACDGILRAVQSGEISEERINESVRRILKMKLSLARE